MPCLKSSAGLGCAGGRCQDLLSQELIHHVWKVGDLLEEYDVFLQFNSDGDD